MSKVWLTHPLVWDRTLPEWVLGVKNGAGEHGTWDERRVASLEDLCRRYPMNPPNQIDQNDKVVLEAAARCFMVV